MWNWKGRLKRHRQDGTPLHVAKPVPEPDGDVMTLRKAVYKVHPIDIGELALAIDKERKEEAAWRKNGPASAQQAGAVLPKGPKKDVVPQAKYHQAAITHWLAHCTPEELKIVEQYMQEANTLGRTDALTKCAYLFLCLYFRLNICIEVRWMLWPKRLCPLASRSSESMGCTP